MMIYAPAKSSFRHVLRSFLLAVLLLCGSAGAHAEVRYYQYDGNLPFIQMMLNMMVAMGILDRLPGYGPYASPYGYGGYGGSPWSSFGGDYANPYTRALALRGLSPYSGYGGYGNNPFLRSPWLASPWTSPLASNGIWGNPRWGVLPADSYSPYYPYANPYVDPYAGPYTTPYDDLTEGWVNEPWETSPWNPDAVAEDEQQNDSAPLQQKHSQNKHPEQQSQPQPQQNRQRQPYASSPLAKLAPVQGRPQQNQRSLSGQSVNRPQQNRPSQKRQTQKRQDRANYQPVKQKPCITDFCGLKKPNINGLWVSQNGEMLGIKNGHFLWSDGTSRYLSGRMKLKSDYLLFSVDETSTGPVGTQQIMQFKYKLAGNRLLTMQPDGVIKEFVRTAPGY